MGKNQSRIPNGWIEITLGDVMKYEQPYKYTVKSTAYDDKSGIPVLTAGKSFILGYTNEIDNIYTNYPVIIFDDFTTDCKFVDFPFKVKSSAMKFLSPKNEKDQNINFFFEIIKSLRVRGTSSDHKRRWISEFSKIKIYTPLFCEQKQIAEILITTDITIEETDKLIAKYQRIKTGLMQDLLTNGIDANGNIRNKATHKFVIKNGVEVPEEWEVETFKNLCILIKDGTHLPPPRVEQGIWLLGVSNIIEGEWKMTASDTQISLVFYNNMHKNWKIEVGDVLLAIVGATIGKVTQVPREFSTFTIQRNVCLLRGKEKRLSNDYLRLFIESLIFQRSLWNEVNVTAQPAIFLDSIGKFLITKPSFEEQLIIVEIINTLKESIDSLKESYSKLQLIKTGLMQDLLSGKVRVKIKENKIKDYDKGTCNL